jgi:hypothetical protein
VSGGAYRPDPPSGDEEVARLAAEGQRILDARASNAAARRRGDEKDRERNLRIALGGHYHGLLVRAAAILLIVVGATAPIAVSVLDIDALGWGTVALFGGIALLLWAPSATRARVRAERAWVRSLPFPMDGYFEALGDDPVLGMTLVVSIAWREGASAPSESTLQGLLGLLDTGARVVSCDVTAARVRSGSISGRTGIMAPGGFVHRNTRLVGYVHRMVESILLPLHRGGRLERVSLSRE